MKIAEKILVFYFLIFILSVSYPLVAEQNDKIVFSIVQLQNNVKHCVEHKIKLPDEIENFYSIESVEGFVVDEHSYDVIIFGKKGDNVLTLDDFVVALRCATFSNEPPGVTIDPRVTAADPYKIQDVRFFGPVENTYFGYTLFDADYLLKKIAANVVTPEITDFYTYRDLIIQSAKEEMKTCSGKVEPKESLNRFWFYPSNILFAKSDNGDVGIVKQCEISLLTEKQFLDKSEKKLVSLSGERDELAEKFAYLFTNRYNDFCNNYFVYRRLHALFKLYALAKFMVEERVPVDIDYLLNEYKTKEFHCPKSVKGVNVSGELQHEWQDKKYRYVCIHKYGISGGVSIDVKIEPENVLKITQDETDKIKNDILKQASLFAAGVLSTKINFNVGGKTQYFLSRGTYSVEDIRYGIIKNKLDVSFSPVKNDSEEIYLCGDTVEMCVTNKTNEIQRYKVLPGSILKNVSSFSQDAIVFKLKGEVVDNERYIVTERIELLPKQTKRYVLEVYALGFKKKRPLTKSEFYISNKNIKVLNKINFKTAEKLSVISKQIALWTLVEGISSKMLKERFEIDDKEIYKAKEFLIANGFFKEANLLK